MSTFPIPHFRGRGILSDDGIYLNQNDVVAWLAEVEEVLVAAEFDAAPDSLLQVIRRQLGCKDSSPV